MIDTKIIISVLVVALIFIGYVPYILDTLRGRTIPHSFTWFIWSLATAIVYVLQVNAGAGVGSWATLTVATVCFCIFILALTKKDNDITSSDIVFLLLALGAIFLWLVVKQPVLSIILIVTADILAFIPTIRKSWNKPYSETLFSFELNVVRHALSIVALQEYSIITWLYPVSWTIADLFFSILLIVRRKQVANMPQEKMIKEKAAVKVAAGEGVRKRATRHRLALRS